ncbi:MAG: lipase [Nostocaceae cyanobacterium]|nr:lipase [Nostocaceae cyanobacterium]
MKDSQYLPIIFVCGYAGTQKDVESRVEDPFYGFNKGSSHVRVGEQGNTQKFFFESPLLRLIKDHGYLTVFEAETQKIILKNKSEQARKTIWIYRYYDITSESFDQPGGIRLEMEDIAKGLREFINNVKQQTNADKVNLIAYSMGGLVCRSLIQKIYPDNKEKAADHIDKFFTYGAPHGGIYFALGGGILESLRDQFGWNNSDDFGPVRMYEYLTPQAEKKASVPPDFDYQSFQGKFPEDRAFCIVGTNAKDYPEAFGIAQVAVGPQSDGLVQIQKAYVKGTHRAYIHRSHGGSYGMLNSEEGYQNLQRFFFGDVKVKLSLTNVELRDLDKNFYQMEVRVAIRGLPSVIHEQSIAHNCPITLELTRPKPTPLFTAFLVPRYSATADNTSRYVIRLALHSYKKQQDWLFDRNLDQVPIWSDYLIFDVQSKDNKYKATYSWISQSREPINGFSTQVPLPINGKAVLGQNAAVLFEIYDWK